MRHFTIKYTSACIVGLSVLALLSTARGDQATTGSTPTAGPSSSAELRAPSVRFADLQKAEDPSFRRHVIPLLARVGCSARECHGSFQGRGGFQLSLFGSEWDHDHIQLTQNKGDEDEIRTNLQEPEKSLILMKPTLQMKHKGKLRFKKDGWEYNLLLKWIKDGAKDDAPTNADFDRLEVQPAEIVFQKPGDTSQLKVLAHWKDGSVEDVTELTRFRTNDEAIVSVSESGLVASLARGDSHVVASYDNGVLPIPVMLPVSEFAGAKFPQISGHGRVDELVIDKLRKMGIVPAEVCTDAEFLRRASLDVTGTLPTPDEINKFLADPSPTKRAAKIEELLNRPAYSAWWTTKLCDYTGNSPRELNIGGGVGRLNPAEFSRQWYAWINKRVAANMPYDELVAGIVLATGRSAPDESYKDYALEMGSYFRSDNPKDFADHPTLPYFWQRRNTQLPQEKALAFAHAFLGVKLECAQCHKHPFDRWTKTDFAQFTAFFNGIAYAPRPAAPGEECTYQSLNKEVKDKVEKDIDDKNIDPKKEPGIKQKALSAEVMRRIDADEPAPWLELWVNNNGAKRSGKKNATVDSNTTPKILGGQEVALTQFPDPRKPLMEWLRSGANPYFAKAFVNRVWANYFNRGIVEPADDLNLANAPCNGELLNYLAEGFVSHNYDMKWLHREILNSDTYQRSWKTNPTNQLDNRNFSHAVVRQLPAEVMLDSIDIAIAADGHAEAVATDIDNRAIGAGSNAAYGRGGKGGKQQGKFVDNYFLTLFGRPLRESNCDCERTEDPTLLQTLFTRNDPQLLARIEGTGKPDSSWISELRRAGDKNLNVDKSITDAFLRTVSRPPTDQEVTEARADIAAAKAPVDGVRDLFWALLNTREFKVNH
jgi:hypothetical protein